MQPKNRGILIGTLIILIGLAALLGNLGVFYLEEDFLWGVVFLVGGLVFISLCRRDPNKWWALIPGGALGFIGVIIILDSMRVASGDVIGTVFLWGLGATFISVYLVKTENWWAVIPGGVLLVLGTIVLLNTYHLVDDDFIGFILFFGIGLVFGFLYLIRNEKTPSDWAKYPASILILFSFFILLVTSDKLILELILPILLIGLGACLVYKNVRRGQTDRKAGVKSLDQDQG